MTQEFLANMKESREDTKENFVKEVYVGSTSETTAQMTAAAIGGVRVLDQLIEMIEDLTKEDEVTGNE